MVLSKNSLSIVVRDPGPMLQAVLQQWGGETDLWVFGYASLIWRPEFSFTERHLTKVHGWHRALKMWSRLNRGTPECPGLVFALLAGGSCQGVAFRIEKTLVRQTLSDLWEREMPTGVYNPRWLQCETPTGSVKALAFTLPHDSQNYTGELSAAQYQYIFKNATGRFGTTHEYAQKTYDCLLLQGIHDQSLETLLQHALT